MSDPQTIELDCAPGDPRPGDLIYMVVAGTDAEPLTTPDNTVSRLFGCWTWHYPSLTKEQWAEVQKVTAPRIREMYHKGLIRYGSW